MRLPQRYQRYLPYLPAAAAFILVLPVLGFTYLWDDYTFLTNAFFYQLHDWAPDPIDPFYRPISRGVYFTLLDLCGSGGALVGHLLNLGLLLAVILLFGSLVSRLAGWRAGLLSSLLFAGLGAVPALVAWVCCDQDLLAILFTLLALHLRLSGRFWAALGAVAAGLLSKETTLSVIPVLVLFDWILGRKPYRLLKQTAAYGLLVAVWAFIHPAVRTLLARGLRSGATGYVGLEHPERWPIHLGRYLLTLFNVPAFSPVPAWPVFGVLVFLGAGMMMMLAIRETDRDSADVRDEGQTSRPRLILLGAMLAAGPLLLTSTMIRGWAPYYAAFPALGFFMIAGPSISALPMRAKLTLLAVFLALGVWSRGDLENNDEAAEGNFRVVSTAMKQVEAGFHRLYPRFEPNTRVMLSIQTYGTGGVYTHMYSLAVLRIWYRDRTLRVIRPEARTPSNEPEVLTVIAPDRDILDIHLGTLFARSASRRNPDYDVCETAVRAYAMGLAGSGATDEAVGMLFRMPEVSVGFRSIHQRMAAMFLLAEQRDHEAQAILDSTIVLPPEVALADVRAVLAEQPPGKTYDDAGLRAFGISPDSTDTIRQLMQWYADNKYAEVALRFARRVLILAPGDPQAGDVVRKMSALIQERSKAPPVPAAVG